LSNTFTWVSLRSRSSHPVVLACARACRRGVHGGEEGYMHAWSGELDRSILSLASAGGACRWPAGEQAGKECTCPASPPRAPRHIHPPLDLSIDDRSIRRSHLRSRGWIYPCMGVTTPAMYIFSTTCCRNIVSTVPDYVEAEEVDRRGGNCT
jgi:hypothetical protein